MFPKLKAQFVECITSELLMLGAHLDITLDMVGLFVYSFLQLTQQKRDQTKL